MNRMDADLSSPAMDADPGTHLWIVMIAARPERDAALRELRRMLREHGARRVSPDVMLAPDRAGMGRRLKSLADRIAKDGGRVIFAESVILDDRGGEHAK